jgi:hypothetical protein
MVFHQREENPMPAATAPKESSAEGNTDAQTDAIAHAMLRLIGEMPGHHGRVRVARIVGGKLVEDPADRPVDYSPFAIADTFTVKALTELVDSMIAGGFIAQVPGSRPTLVLTRAGHWALDALEGSK